MKKHTSEQVRATLRTLFHTARELNVSVDLGDSREMLEAYAQLLEKQEAPKLEITCTRWFQKSYGNTYHRARIFEDGKLLADSGKHYGYGEQCLQTAWEQLHALGKLPKEYRGSIGLREAGITYSINDVSRERDL